jgi:thiamine kinase-like enzyme
MISSLSSQNVIQYLQDTGLRSSEDGAFAKVELLKSSNNLNLLVSADNHRLLVKQGGYPDNDGTPQQLFKEWLFHQLLCNEPVLSNIAAINSLVVHFDEDNNILVRNYLTEYLELGYFYKKNNIFPREIASTIGATLATLHRATFNCREYRNFIATTPKGVFGYQFYNPAQTIGLVGPEIFGNIPTEALKFYLLYQHYDSLEAAIAELASDWKPCCLTHNDLKLENILLHSRFESLDNPVVRIIDWEACAWGDPAYELGSLVANYLKIWLSSLVVDPTLDFEESLLLAVTPLDDIQPSILALIKAYLNTFPAILEYRQDLLLRVVQFAGLALFNHIKDNLNCNKSFNNTHICMLQVAKLLLTIPQQSVQTIFGASESEITRPFTKMTKMSIQDKGNNLMPIYHQKTRLRGC